MAQESDEALLFQSTIHQATYHEQRIPSYSGNPLIEALPPLSSRDEIYQQLMHCPIYSDQHRRYSLEERLHLLGHGQRFFQPLSQHIDIARRFSRMVRDGYIGRNPLGVGFWPESQERLNVLSKPMPSVEEMRGFNQGFTIIGVSGMGKSRAVERITSLYPQVIQHTHYHGKRFTWRQLVWLTLDCPFDGTLSGLCTQFFREVDQKLSANYHAMYGLRNAPPRAAMLSIMATVASNHSLGALIIDEIQNLKETRRQDSTALLNFLVQLDNTIGVPVVLIGTPQAAEVLGGEFRRARRAAGQGDLIWERMPNDNEWRFFLETLWHYQYTQHYRELDDELAQTLYYESQGIIDIAMKVFFLAQMHAIAIGEERLSRSMLTRASQQSLRLVQPFLDSFRQNKTKKLSLFGDYSTKELEGAFQLSSQHREQAQAHKAEQEREDNTPRSSQERAKENQAAQPEQRKRHSTKSLPLLVAEGGKNNLSAYEALDKAGCISHIDEVISREHASPCYMKRSAANEGEISSEESVDLRETARVKQ